MRIEGTPSSGASGTYNYNINAYNGTNTETLSGAITIIASSTTNSCSLILNTTSDSGTVSQTIYEGSSINELKFNANTDCQNIVFSSSGLPPGLQPSLLNTTNYRISGTPSSGVTGTYYYSVRAASGTFSKTLYGAITIVASSSATTNSCVLGLTTKSNSGAVSQTITTGSAIDALRFEINYQCPTNINFSCKVLNLLHFIFIKLKVEYLELTIILLVPLTEPTLKHSLEL